MGKEDDCRASVEAVTELIGHHGSLSMLGFAHSALGLLELGLGRAGEARDAAFIGDRAEVALG